MVFFNNPHAARAIMQNRHDELSDQIAPSRPTRETGRTPSPSLTPLPRTKPAVQAAA